MNLKATWKKLHGSKKTFRNGLYASALTVVVLAAVVLLNLVIQALPTKYTELDISTSSLFTLSDTSKNLLHELQTDVTAYYLAVSGQEDTNITRLLDRYADESSHFTWQQRDPVLYPTFAEKYEGASTGCVVMTTGDRYDVVSYDEMYQIDMEAYYYGSEEYSFDAENSLTASLANVIRTTSYQMYELTGHGETALADCGMTRQAGLLVETNGDNYPYGYPQTYLMPNVQSSEILAGMTSGMRVYTPIAQGIVQAEDSEYTMTPLLMTSDAAYSLVDYQNAETVEKSDTDPEGSFAVAMAAQNDTTGAKVVWVNCPNMLLSTANQSVSGGNAQMFGSVVNWFNGEQTTAVINSKSMSAASLVVPNAARIGLALLFVFVLPIVCLIAGVVICLIRRRR